MRAGAWRTVAQHRATKDLMREIRSRHPGLRAAIGSDLRLSAANRDERAEYHSRWDELAGAIRLAWISDAFFAQTLYRLKAWLQQRGVPVLPRLAHRLAMSIAQVCIGDPVVMHPGVYIAHGQVVIDGFVEVHSGVVISPFVTIGVRGGGFASPTIGPNVEIGTGAKILGAITIGAGAKIGANAVVLDDVPPGATVVGVPARIVRSPDRT